MRRELELEKWDKLDTRLSASEGWTAFKSKL
jgi:hypothetical protein